MRWVVIAVVGCACHAIPDVPSQGGPAWIELTSDHFTVWTDASADEGRELVKTMEHLRQIVFGVSVFNPTSNARGFVIALRHQREVDAYLPKQFIALAWSPDVLAQPGILLSIDGLDHDRRVVTHELTHVISFNALTRQPRWFAEGLAGYFETLQLDEDTGSFELGAPLQANLKLLRRDGLMPVDALFACVAKTCMDNQFYATAWALFAYLTNKHPTELLRYVERLAVLPANQQGAAWAETFPELTPARLDPELANWVRFGEIKVSSFKVKLKAWPTTERRLGDGDVYAARALMRDLYHGNDPNRPDLEAALKVDPTNIVAHMLALAHDHAITPEVARAVAAAHPDDWRAWWLVNRAVQGEEQQAALAKACALLVKNPAVLPRGTCP
jgi:hypothetical protein